MQICRHFHEWLSKPNDYVPSHETPNLAVFYRYFSSAWSVEEIFAGKMSHFKNIAMTLCMHHICFAVVKASFTLDVILMWTLQWPYQKGWMSVTLAPSLFGVNRLIWSSDLLSSHETHLWVNNLCTLSLTRRHDITFRLKASDLCVGWYAIVLKGSKGELSPILY